MREGQYYNFCLEHAREYNKTYNYFRGMSDNDMANFRESDFTGHRPTWKMGVNSHAHGPGEKPSGASQYDPRAAHDSFDFFGGRSEAEAPRRRTVRNAERKALNALNLEETATGPEIKNRYKELVKRHHPDANGGDRGTEDRLREIIEAHNYLKSSGFCDGI